MNKFSKLLLIPAGFVVLVFLVFLAGGIRLFKVPTQGNYPTLKPGAVLAFSSFLNPERLDFICYKDTIPQIGEVLAVHRLCGLPGDKIEIRDGILFVNDENVDKQLHLAHSYDFQVSQASVLQESGDYTDADLVNISKDTMRTFIADDLVRRNTIKAQRMVIPKTETNEGISLVYRKNWNQDQFGPLRIPEGKAFVLGDNRHHSLDSRFSGLVNLKDIKGKVLFR